ncbi:MAG TPA: histidine kinase [Desulfomicrobium sp.]|nr:histidine kinase [Desulfomicrobium sp.]
MPDRNAENLHLLSRNPVFTAAKNVWGYEIQATASLVADPAAETDRPDVGAAVIAGEYIGLNTILARNKKMLLAYTPDQLRKQVPYAFPARSSAVLVTARGQSDPSLTPVLRQMAEDGHTIVLEWSPLVTPQSAALEPAEMICLASPALIGDQGLAAILATGKGCLARGVTSADELEALKRLGANLFQGRFFKTAEIIPGRKLSSHQNSRLRILGVIEEPSPDLDHLARVIQSDVSLSYRLLTYLNSPAFGFMRKIDSIRQAITLLGWINVRNWLRAVLMADMAQGETQVEVLHVSLRRGRFLEQLVTSNDYWNFRPDEMFLLGMFSLLDAILGVSMTEALASLPLTEAQKKALTASGPTEYAPLLALMAAFEEGGHSLDRMLQDLSLDPAAARRLHLEAGAWASAILDLGRAG